MNSTVDFGRYGIAEPDLLLPAPGVDAYKWATVACDQFTQDAEYWNETERITGGAPSSLRITLPEIFLSESETRTPAMLETMARYLEGGVFTPHTGFILAERRFGNRLRRGVMALCDLDSYEYVRGSSALIRASEATVAERLPPRVKVRAEAPLEIPHVMMLYRDEGGELLRAAEPALKSAPLYDTPLMQGGGRLTGYPIGGECHAGMARALERMLAVSDGLLFAVGDGNHSLAAAKAVREADRNNARNRYALCELVNVYDKGLVFEPIHRVACGVDAERLAAEFAAFAEKAGGKNQVRLAFGGAERRFALGGPNEPECGAVDAFLAGFGAGSVDYVHGEAEALAAARGGGRAAFLLGAMEKPALFEIVQKRGALPKKCFSMGEAREKRYYFEARRLT